MQNCSGTTRGLADLDSTDRKIIAPIGGLLPIAPDPLLHALPHPVLVLRGDNRVVYVNFAAEVFFGMGENVLKRRRIDGLVAFASPLLALINQVRQTRTTVNEYAVDVGLPDRKSVV